MIPISLHMCQEMYDQKSSMWHKGMNNTVKQAVLAGKFFRTKNLQGRPTGKRPILLSKIFPRCPVSQCHPQGGEESQQKRCVGLNSKKRDISMVASIRTSSEHTDVSEAKSKGSNVYSIVSRQKNYLLTLNHGDNNMTYFRGLLGGLKQLIQVKYLELFLAQGDWASVVAQMVKNLLAIMQTRV